MIELPGSFSGKEISPKPQRGPDPRNLKSLAIFIRDTAITLSAPDTYEREGQPKVAKVLKLLVVFFYLHHGIVSGQSLKLVRCGDKW